MQTSGDLSPWAGVAHEGVMRDLDALVEQSQQRFELFSAAQQQIDQVTVTERSPDGSVQVTVRSSGALTGLVLSDRIRSMMPSQVAAMVLSCVQVAQARIADNVAAILQSKAPGDPLTHEFIAEAREQFPAPQVVHQPPPPPRARPVRPRDDGDDWDGRPVLSR
jgi:DNA-binding protein YbaB